MWTGQIFGAAGTGVPGERRERAVAVVRPGERGLKYDQHRPPGVLAQLASQRASVSGVPSAAHEAAVTIVEELLPP